MTNGKINLQPSAFGGYYIVQNAGLGIKGGHAATMQFLEANRRHFDVLAQCGSHLAIKADRVAKFTAFANANGLEVVGA